VATEDHPPPARGSRTNKPFSTVSRYFVAVPRRGTTRWYKKLPENTSANAATQENEEEVLAEGSVIQKTKLYLPEKVKNMLWLKEGDRVEYVLDKVAKKIHIRKKE